MCADLLGTCFKDGNMGSPSMGVPVVRDPQNGIGFPLVLLSNHKRKGVPSKKKLSLAAIHEHTTPSRLLFFGLGHIITGKGHDSRILSSAAGFFEHSTPLFDRAFQGNQNNEGNRRFPTERQKEKRRSSPTRSKLAGAKGRK